MKYNEIKQLKYKYNKKVKYRKIKDMLMAYNEENGDTYEFNEIGSEIFMYLYNEIPFDKIIENLLKNYNVLEEDIKEDIEDIINRIIELKIIIF